MTYLHTLAPWSEIDLPSHEGLAPSWSKCLYSQKIVTHNEGTAAAMPRILVAHGACGNAEKSNAHSGMPETLQPDLHPHVISMTCYIRDAMIVSHCVKGRLKIEIFIISRKTAFKHKSQLNILEYSKLSVADFDTVNSHSFHIKMFTMVVSLILITIQSVFLTQS